MKVSSFRIVKAPRSCTGHLPSCGWGQAFPALRRSVDWRREWLHVARDVSVQQSGGSNPVITGLVSAMTESLRVLGVGKQQYKDITQRPSQHAQLAPGDIQGVMQRITQDYQQAYFVTGVIDDSIYDQDCTFADPTVQFSGLDLWKRNLQLLVPFLIKPRIELLSIAHIGNDGQGAEQIKAEWTLNTVLALPWRPRVSILGSTVYTLNSDANQVVRHVESWNVTAAQALLQIVTPGKPLQQD